MTQSMEVVHDISNLDYENHYITVNHPKLDYKSWQEFGIRYHEDKLKTVEGIFDPIDIVLDKATDVVVALTTNIELEPISNENVDEPIHFLAIVGEIRTKEVDGFILFSFDDEIKDQANKASTDIEWLRSSKSGGSKELKMLKYLQTKRFNTVSDVSTRNITSS
ncbi:hypothetical protein PVK06_007736 [Gossypium arboreum]|uniref:Uncharacterized protein n=1 Tax=Gossypium arboreum TaxID=29729 RepID=A0ABR0QIF7_GOSAR|nr:hypothetical protein PVK06_007736 [Gossypium arboreum]